jgi:hypothetical protein
MNATIGTSCFASVPYSNGSSTFWVGLALPTSNSSCVNGINAGAPVPPPNLEYQACPIAFTYYKNSSAMSAAFCYATYQLYTVTVELDLLTGRLIPQVWDKSLVPGYFSGQDYLWARNGFVHLSHVQRFHSNTVLAGCSGLELTKKLTTLRFCPIPILMPSCTS